MINALLLRIHQSGHLVNLSSQRSALVKEAISYYKEIRQDIRQALPFWPLGLSMYRDPWVSLGLRTEKRDYIAVWRRDSQTDRVVIPVKHRKGQKLRVTCGYPQAKPCKYQWNSYAGELTVELPARVSARLFQLDVEE
jgi:alpha-galactosidase